MVRLLLAPGWYPQPSDSRRRIFVEEFAQMTFKDLFSAQSADYARFRPTYPPSLFAWLASVAPARGCAVDVATGNGQAALGLADHFARVVALDASAAQVAEASARGNVEYGVAPAEATGLPAGSADLLTAAQAFHWFQHDRFFPEAQRVLRPGGVLAVWCYGLARITPAVDEVVRHLYQDLIGAYWEPERMLVETGYRDVAVPFAAIESPPFETQLTWELSTLTGYLRTWSALKAFMRARGSDPLASIEPDLIRAWGDAPSHPARWTLSVRAFRA
jgi:SAM-dependent methyltransferase